MKLLTAICALALVVSFAAVASAEVQNVKVSGDLTMYTIWRNNYDLGSNDDIVHLGVPGLDVGVEAASQNWFQSAAEVQVDADLTDNVSTCIRMINQRDWDDPEVGSDYTASVNTLDVLVDLAYVRLKEILYSPLTVTIGRQDLWFGQGFIVGAKQRDPSATIAANEYTVINSFDAIRATLDYNPWTIDLVYSKIEENSNESYDPIGKNDDVDLYIANVGYKFDSYKGEVEAYYVGLFDRSDVVALNESNETDTIGLRGSFDPIADMTIGAEGAYQFGDFAQATNDPKLSIIERDRHAWATDLSGEYRWPNVKWTPKLGLEYVYYSGEENDKFTDSGDWRGWNPVFRGKTFSAIREFQNIYYRTNFRTDSAFYNYEQNPDQDSGMSNEHQIIVTGQLKPTENVTFDAEYAHFIQAQKSDPANTKADLGDELDFALTYNYTEDVTFGLLAAWFIPGSYFPNGQDDTAADLVGSMKVSF